MKTYWLQAKECRPPIPRINSDIKTTIEEIEPLITTKENIQEAGRSVVYSPITFKDVARRSIASSPTKGNAKGKQ